MNCKPKELVRKILLVFLISMSIASVSSAQCAMCKRVAESDMQNKRKETAARSLNNGILYLLSIPYLIGGAFGIAWWMNKRKGS